MGSALVAFALVVAMLIVIVVLMPNNERFDVYNNHGHGAQTVYETSGIPFMTTIQRGTPRADLDLEQARRLAKYTWSEADPRGLNVFDIYYENFVNQHKYADQRRSTASDEIAYRDIGDDIGINNVYDTKFHVYSGDQAIDGYTNYTITGMADPDPLYMQFNGENIVLNQKNF